MVPRSKLEAAEDEVQRTGLEVERVRRTMESMVPRVQWETAQDEIARLTTDAHRLQVMAHTLPLAPAPPLVLFIPLSLYVCVRERGRETNRETGRVYVCVRVRVCECVS